MFCACLTLIGLLLYVFFDVNYFIRIFFTIGFAKLFQKKVKPSETTRIYGLCTTQDVDIFMRHMNNARYVRELDFARFHFYFLSGIYDEVVKRGGNALQGASSVRYRRTIPILSPYRIETKVVFWDEKCLYLEQKFVTLTDGFVRAIIHSKQNIVGVNVVETLKALGMEAPICPPEIEHWMQSIEVSSAKLRPDTDKNK